MKKRYIERDEINKITQECQYPREKAFFTFMRQSGLPPRTISQLKIRNLERILEPDTPIPCKITKNEFKSPPHFIGGEAVKYLKQYLATRKNLAPENLLFTSHDDQNHKINTKNVSRTFKLIAQKLAREKRVAYKVKVGKPSELRLYSLIHFYKNNTKYYRKEAKNHPFEDDEFFRSLYKNHAMPFLELETQITIQIYKPKKQYQKEIEYQNNQIKEMKQTIAKDNEYISSILTVLYNNKGDYETGENVELGNCFIELWKKTAEEQRQNMRECWNRKTKLLPYKDILEELTKTLNRIIKPYEELKKTQGIE